MRQTNTEQVPASLSDTHQYLVKNDIKGGLTSALLANRAMARGIPVAPDAKRRLSMQVGKRRVWFDGARSNLNSVLASRCTRYKDVTSRLLLNYGVRAPENVAFQHHQVLEAWAWAAQKTPVVVKPPNEGMGSSVHVGITEFAEFEEAFTAVSAISDDVLVERFIPGVEHRVLLVYGKVAAVARRVPANVIGDGASTVSELIEEKNRLRTESQNPVHYQIPVDEVVTRELGKQQLNLDVVPEQGRQVWLRPNSNVHSGGDGVDATDDLSPEEVELAENVARAIPGLRLAGIDMLLPREGQGSEPYVLEVNSTPMMTGHHFPWVGQSRDVAEILVASMFPESKPTDTSDSELTAQQKVRAEVRRNLRILRRRWRWFRDKQLR
ncbi:ATP-grasp domain-containing protein [Nesterenkonia alkaliphila]|uniref:ATP-grasp domain-containing protein n=1 Tax=Nesterenkonia alkaliphila TaxID=1463631 RepID=A0A7K1UMC9_9MICC|nr:ATP-grasp domain-containing protein [Nesterenkonia alkaliphila]MVT27462.1 ATP-grasp domain-containing protein [Nesterenkonia alkaliphila]